MGSEFGGDLEFTVGQKLVAGLKFAAGFEMYQAKPGTPTSLDKVEDKTH